MSTEHPNFDGQLVYRACETREIEATELLQVLADSESIPEDSEPGVEHIGFEPLLFQSPEELESERAREIEQRIHMIRYLSESFGAEATVYDPDQDTRTSGMVVNPDSADIATLSPDTILVRSPQRVFEEVYDYILERSPRGGRVRRISFSSDFLLWLYWRHISESHPDPEPRPITLSGASFTGEMDMFGHEMDLSDSELAQSAVVIMSLSSGNQFQSLRGTFECQDNYIKMNISNDGRIHVLTAGDLRSTSTSERVLLASDAVDTMIESYRNWESRPPGSKYPPFEFFSSLQERLSDYEINGPAISDAVIERYAEKRGEDISEYTGEP